MFHPAAAAAAESRQLFQICDGTCKGAIVSFPSSVEVWSVAVWMGVYGVKVADQPRFEPITDESMVRALESTFDFKSVVFAKGSTNLPDKRSPPFRLLPTGDLMMETDTPCRRLAVTVESNKKGKDKPTLYIQGWCNDVATMESYVPIPADKLELIENYRSIHFNLCFQTSPKAKAVDASSSWRVDNYTRAVWSSSNCTIYGYPVIEHEGMVFKNKRWHMCNEPLSGTIFSIGGNVVAPALNIFHTTDEEACRKLAFKAGLNVHFVKNVASFMKDV